MATIGWNLDTTRQQLISSLMTLGAFISSGAAGFIAIKLGRKMSLWLACILCVAANIIMMTTEDIGALYAGRLLIGLANGMLMTFSQLYIQESATAKHRGLFLALFQLSTSVVSERPVAAPSCTCRLMERTNLAGNLDRHSGRLGYVRSA